MKIEIDFVTNKSLGNVYDKSVPDNNKVFEDAQILYKKNKGIIDGLIIDTLNFQKSIPGTFLKIPTLDCPDRGFISSLDLRLETKEVDACFLVLLKVH